MELVVLLPLGNYATGLTSMAQMLPALTFLSKHSVSFLLQSAIVA